MTLLIQLMEECGNNNSLMEALYSYIVCKLDEGNFHTLHNVQNRDENQEEHASTFNDTVKVIQHMLKIALPDEPQESEALRQELQKDAPGLAQVAHLLVSLSMLAIKKEGRLSDTLDQLEEADVLAHIQEGIPSPCLVYLAAAQDSTAEDTVKISIIQVIISSLRISKNVFHPFLSNLVLSVALKELAELQKKLNPKISKTLLDYINTHYKELEQELEQPQKLTFIEERIVVDVWKKFLGPETLYQLFDEKHKALLENSLKERRDMQQRSNAQDSASSLESLDLTSPDVDQKHEQLGSTHPQPLEDECDLNAQSEFVSSVSKLKEEELVSNAILANETPLILEQKNYMQANPPQEKEEKFEDNRDKGKQEENESLRQSIVLKVSYAKDIKEKYIWEFDTSLTQLIKTKEKNIARQLNQQDQLALYITYDTTDGIEQDQILAVKYWASAAEQGDARAQFNLGVAYNAGEGVAQDRAMAVKYWTFAADQGFAQAQFALGIAHNAGEGVAQDQVLAVKWWTLAAEQGLAQAQFALGVAYDTGKGVAQDQAKAVKYWTSAAEQGLAQAQFNLGVAYSVGKGVAQDQAKAVKYWTSAAEQGLAQAQFNLGVAYNVGEGVVQDPIMAVKYWVSAAEQGLMQAQFALNIVKPYQAIPEKWAQNLTASHASFFMRSQTPKNLDVENQKDLMRISDKKSVTSGFIMQPNLSNSMAS